MIVAFLIFMTVQFHPESMNAQEIENDFYNIRPAREGSITKRLTADLSGSTKKLINYSFHGLGNQMFGFEWRPEENAYIIYKGNNKQVLLSADGTSEGSTVSTKKIDKTINNLTVDIGDENLWTLEKSTNSNIYSDEYGSMYYLKNKKSTLVLTQNSLTSEGNIVQKKQVNGLNQQFFLTRFNGYYTMENVYMNWKSVLDISGGIQNDADINVSRNTGLDSQQWYASYQPDINSYVIGNTSNKRLLIKKTSASSIKTSLYDSSNPLDTSFGFVFKPGITDVLNSIIYTNSTGNIALWRYWSSETSVVTLRTLPANGIFEPAEWKLKRIGDLIPPVVRNVSMTSDRKTYFVGEVLTINYKVESTDFEDADIYFRRYSDKYSVVEPKKKFTDGVIEDVIEVDTSELTEGMLDVEFMAKGLGIFTSNSLALKVDLKYPTPTATAIPKRIKEGTDVKTLKADDFVNDVKDELGNKITLAIKSLDTSKIGTTEAVIELANEFKKTEVKVPVEIYPKISTISVNFLNKDGDKLHDTIDISGNVDSTIDLSSNQKVVAAIKKVLATNYTLVERPVNEGVIPFMDKNSTATYRFNGLLLMQSAPTAFDFEMKTATIEAIKYTNPKIVGKPLVVIDTREGKLQWSLKAKLDKPLTSLDDSKLEIPDAIKYKNKDDEMTLSNENTTIVTHTNAVAGSFDITEEQWSKGDGFMVDLAPGAIKSLGNYQAKITITLENAK